MNAEPTERFSDRVDNYVKYRPSYPPEVIDFLANECRLEPGTPIADVGSGTGIFSKLLLDRCFRVYAVEPNAAMQHAAREQFKNNTDWIAVLPSQTSALAWLFAPRHFIGSMQQKLKLNLQGY
jgi:precorrin-6B methylase 2